VGGEDGTKNPDQLSPAQKAIIENFNAVKKKDDYLPGTLGYASPEMLIEGGKVGFASDMFTLGVLAFVMLTKEMPFDEKTDKETRKKALAVKYDFPKSIVLSPDAEDFITKLLQYKPEDRLTAQQCLEHPWLRNAF